jgi:hypothetical protein
MDWRWHVNTSLVKIAISLLRLTGWYEGYWNHWRTLFPYAERSGLHILPTHYYSPIPDTRHLSADVWRPRVPVSFDLRIEAAMTWLNQLSKKYRAEYNDLSTERSNDIHNFSLDNAAFGPGDAEIVYAILPSNSCNPERTADLRLRAHHHRAFSAPIPHATAP